MRGHARLVLRHDHLADRPQRNAGQLQVRPGEGNANDGDGQRQRQDQVHQRQPPAGQNQPDDVADGAERPGANVFLAGVPVVGSVTEATNSPVRVVTCAASPALPDIKAYVSKLTAEVDKREKDRLAAESRAALLAKLNATRVERASHDYGDDDYGDYDDGGGYDDDVDNADNNNEQPQQQQQHGP